MGRGVPDAIEYLSSRQIHTDTKPTNQSSKKDKKSNLANQARFRKMSNQNLGLKYEWISVFIDKELANFNSAHIDNFESPNT